MPDTERDVIEAARAWRAVQRDYDKLNELLLSTRDHRLEAALDEAGLRLAEAEEALQTAVDALDEEWGESGARSR